MCDSCKKDIGMDDFSLTIEGNELIADYDAYSCDSSFNEKVTINFCPMCGKKLEPKSTTL
jgi:hypothetical protein